MDLSQLILQLSIWSVMLPVIAGFLFFKQLDESSKIVFYIVLIATVPQLLTVKMDDQKILNVFYNLYTPIEFALVYFLVGNKFQKIFYQRVSRITFILFFLVAAWLFTTYGLYNEFLSELECAACLAQLAWVFMFILEDLLYDRKSITVNYPIFWFVSALLLYKSGSIILFALTRYIYHNPKDPLVHKLWDIHGVLNVVMYILFAIGLYKSHLVSNSKQKTKITVA